jgi:hypothetical protein
MARICILFTNKFCVEVCSVYFSSWEYYFCTARLHFITCSSFIYWSFYQIYACRNSRRMKLNYFWMFKLALYFLITVERSLDVLQLPYFFRSSRQVVLMHKLYTNFMIYLPGPAEIIIYLKFIMCCIYSYSCYAFSCRYVGSLFFCNQYRLLLAAVIPALVWGYSAAMFCTICERQEMKNDICRIK